MGGEDRSAGIGQRRMLSIVGDGWQPEAVPSLEPGIAVEVEQSR
jgi:hypothetical protein